MVYRCLLAGVVVGVALIAGCDGVFDLHRTPDALPPPPEGWLQVSAGGDNTCGLRSDHTLWCWGDNNVGEVGTAFSTPEVTAPVQVGAGTWAQVEVGSRHVCAIDSETHLWCWGRNNLGQTGQPQSEVVPPTDLGAGFLEVASGGDHTCAIALDHHMRCWGRNAYGELGVWTASEPQPAGVDVQGGMMWKRVVTGTHHTCGLTMDDELFCWGDQFLGETTLGVPASGGTDASWAVPNPIRAGTAWSAVTAGDTHTCGVRDGGVIECWGRNIWGQLGAQTQSGIGVALVPTLDQGHHWMDVSAGEERTCGIRDDGTLWCWGYNAFDGLAYPGGNDAERTQVQIPGGSATWTAVAFGQGHLCGLGSDRSLWCAGKNGFGAVGDGTGGAHQAPTKLEGTWQGIAVGLDLACGVATGGHIRCWGQDNDYQLADNDGLPRQRPVDILDGTQVAAGTRQVCAIGTDSGVVCWGDNALRQAGQNTGANVLQPTPLVSPLVATSLALGIHSCAIGASQAWCWGPGDKGQLDGQLRSPPTAVRVNANGSYSQVAAGDMHSCGLTTTNQLFCWGDNSTGQLGAAGGPGLVRVGLSTWKVVRAGSQHTCAIDALDQLYCWGGNHFGQIGDGTTSGRMTPKRVDDKTWKTLALGPSHSCGIRLDGTLWCWGRNHRGELGDGTTEQRTTPVQVPSGSGSQWVDVAAGGEETCALDGDQVMWCWGANGSGQLGDGSSWSPLLRLIK